MKTINIYFDFEFTSLSTDAQPISLGIVSETVHKNDFREIDFGCTWEELQKLPKPSFYAEFSDFDLNRCDDWVKENVVNKLILGKKEFPKEKVVVKHIDFIDRGDYLLYQKEWEKGDHETLVQYDNSPMILGNTAGIKNCLKQWLSQFSDYDITFVCDCGTFDWYWMLQLLAEWDTKKYCAIKNTGLCQVKLGKIEKCPSKMYLNGWNGKSEFECQAMFNMRFGLPKLPSNISPISQDLNDLIAQKKGISVREAFELNREDLATEETINGFTVVTKAIAEANKHNSLWDAKVIKAIYEKIK